MSNHALRENEQKTPKTIVDNLQYHEEQALVEGILAGNEADIVFLLTRLCMPVFVGVIERTQSVS